MSFDEVNEFIKSDDLPSDLVNEAGYIKCDIGVKAVTNFTDGSTETHTCKFIVRKDHLYINMNYKKKLVFTVCSNIKEEWFELDCSCIASVSCFVFMRNYDNYADEKLYLIGTIDNKDFKESKLGGKQQRTKDIEKSWCDSVDALVEYRGLPSDEYMSSYLTSCSIGTGNYGKGLRANKAKGLLEVPLKQSSEKQRAFLSELLNGRFADLDLSLLNTYQCSALIGHLKFDGYRAEEFEENDKKMDSLYKFLLNRQIEGVKNF